MVARLRTVLPTGKVSRTLAVNCLARKVRLGETGAMLPLSRVRVVMVNLSLLSYCVACTTRLVGSRAAISSLSPVT